MARPALLNYGMGNLRSVGKALERVGAEVLVTADAAAAEAADGLVLPGVGAFPRGIEGIRALGLDELIADRVAAAVPLLGICLGMQLLFESSTELGGGQGLGLLRGEVRELQAPGLKVPHIGWESVTFERRSELTVGLDRPTPFYFVHSFAARPADAAEVIGTAAFGERFASAVARARIYGVQFHPEKSSSAGLRLLANFARICARARAPRSLSSQGIA
jgi:imidazole glycerol-phosphate synthase subunit HisH